MSSQRSFDDRSFLSLEVDRLKDLLDKSTSNAVDLAARNLQLVSENNDLRSAVRVQQEQLRAARVRAEEKSIRLTIVQAENVDLQDTVWGFHRAAAQLPEDVWQEALRKGIELNTSEGAFPPSVSVGR